MRRAGNSERREGGVGSAETQPEMTGEDRASA